MRLLTSPDVTLTFPADVGPLTIARTSTARVVLTTPEAVTTVKHSRLALEGGLASPVTTVHSYKVERGREGKTRGLQLPS